VRDVLSVTQSRAVAGKHGRLQEETFSETSSSSSVLLSSLELSDTKVYEPYIRARLGIIFRNPRFSTRIGHVSGPSKRFWYRF